MVAATVAAFISISTHLSFTPLSNWLMLLVVMTFPLKERAAKDILPLEQGTQKSMHDAAISMLDLGKAVTTRMGS